MTTLGLNIVLVEDDDAIREALETFFRLEGYSVRAVASAEEGLALMADGTPTHLLLSDYQLPGEPGTWLIREARARGFVTEGLTATLLFTAHPRPSDVGNVKVLRKPLDLDELLREVEDALAPVRAAEIERARVSLERVRDARAAGITFILYISARSPTSLRAVRRLRVLLDRYDSTLIDVRVIDLLDGASAEADADRIVFTPTLVRRSPTPRVSLLGFDDTTAIEEMLQEAGVPLRNQTEGS